jgi:uncharacterized protein (TIGR00299 family) protein
MPKIAYLECPTGIAGDMCLGAIVNAGVPLKYLVEALNRLGVSAEYQLRVVKVHRNGQQATKVHVDLLSPVGSVSNETIAVTNATTAYHSSDPLAYSETETPASSPSKERPSHSHSHSHNHSHNHQHSHNHSHQHRHSPDPSNQPSAFNHHRQASSRHLPEIEALILAAGLPKRVEVWSLAVFRRLAEAEAAVHGIAPEQVHFHEVGAIDAIVDIVGTCLGLDWLGVEQIYCSPLPTGGGTIWAAHGRLPVPAPAVLKLFEISQIPVYHNGIERELVTPTGAAIATTLAVRFGPPPAMTLLRVGLGAGSIDLSIPNILRLWIGEGKNQVGETQGLGDRGQGTGDAGMRGQGNAEMEMSAASPGEIQTSNFSNAPNSTPHPSDTLEETIAVLETQIDDLNPQAIGYLYEALFAAGALDVFTQAIVMKKSRSGVLLTAICHLEAVPTCEMIIFRETTTLGIRRSTQQRQILQREIQQVQIESGTVRVKVAWAEAGTPINVQPEYEDCAQIAHQYNLPWREVHRLALAAWYQKSGGK